MSSHSTASGFSARTHARTHARRENAFYGSVYYFSVEVTADGCYKTVHEIHDSRVVLGKNKTDPTKTATSKTATSYICAIMCSHVLPTRRNGSDFGEGHTK